VATSRDVLSSFTRWLLFAFFLTGRTPLTAQPPPSSDEAAVLYKQLQASALEKTTGLTNVVLQRDRVTITFTSGTLYFPAPVAGRIRSAVFLGSGLLQATPPPVAFEQDNVRRLLKSDDVSADFKSAVLRFTDDTDQIIPHDVPAGPAPPDQTIRLASEFEPRLLKETGMNISARQLESILNKESPGVFLGQFSGGKRGRFTFLSDPQSRTLLATFGIDAGETGIIFRYNEDLRTSDVWMAFCPQEDYASGKAHYSDSYNLVDTPHYDLSLDLMEPKKVLGMKAKLDLISRVDGLRAISFVVGESLAIDDDDRRKKQLRLLSAKLSDGTALSFFQEPWETGVTVALPAAVKAGQPLTLILELKGDFMMESNTVPGTYFPRSPDTWYPRHGFLVRSTFDVAMVHRKKDHVVSLGELVKEEPRPEANDSVLTEFRMNQPVGLSTFAVGQYEIHKSVAKEDNGRTLPLEFYSPFNRVPIKQDFILAEMSNCVRFFSKLYGEYPYPLFRGVYHPFNFGQGFATTIMIPKADYADYTTYAFIAHETSHQWWGDMVTWRSYRDQWLSEGFAEYSGMLYVQTRDKTAREIDLIKRARETLKLPPHNVFGPESGRLVDVGPLIMGHRLETRETRGAYMALTYSKGALVLRMMHFLFTDPQTGDGQAFLDLMSDFVRRHLNSTASTEQFFAVANDRVLNTPLARRYGYKNLNWFYRQWVTQTYLPSYELAYHLEDQPDGTVLLKGELYQRGLPEKETWFTPLPLVIRYPGGKSGFGTVAVQGEQTPINIKLPARPERVELDPDLWILSDKTSTTKH
jgi:peptidase M1-like protein